MCVVNFSVLFLGSVESGEGGEGGEGPAKKGKQWLPGAATQSSHHHKGNPISSDLLSSSKCFGLYTVLLTGFAVVNTSLISVYLVRYYHRKTNVLISTYQILLIGGTEKPAERFHN